MKNISNCELKQSYIAAHNLETHLSSTLLSALRLKQIEAGEYLVSQGCLITSLYLLVFGKLQVEHYQEDGNRAVFSIEKAFSVIGDLELFHENKSGNVSTVKALTQAHILEIPVTKVKQHGLTEAPFLHFICKQLSSKLYESSQLHSNAAFKATFKVRKYLAYRAQSDGPVIQLEKREAIAAMLGLSVRQLNRSLRELAELELIKFKNKTVKVADPHHLADISPTGF